jgi:cytochrome oxidase Cu insertion factor (SCO1/SenC/PrrC family)
MGIREVVRRDLRAGPVLADRWPRRRRTADPILALAIEGGSITLDFPAPGFRLTDQNGQTATLASLHGKVVLMTLLDPVCTTDCPIIGQEFKEAGVLVGAQDKEVELVAIVANPTYRSVALPRRSTARRDSTRCRTGCT